jgi:hypothetical protein
MTGASKLRQQQPNNSQFSRRVVPAGARWCGQALHRTVQGEGESRFQILSMALCLRGQSLIGNKVTIEFDVTHSKQTRESNSNR